MDKVWEGDDASWRPESVTVRIVAENNPSIFDEATLSEANNWKHTWDDLYKYDASEAIRYTVAETEIPEGYQAKITGSGTGKLMIYFDDTLVSEGTIDFENGTFY